MVYKRIVKPAVFPVTLEEAKANARIEHSEEDLLIQGMLEAASEHCERIQSKAYGLQSWQAAFEHFPLFPKVLLRKAPFHSLKKFYYLNALSQEVLFQEGTDFMVDDTGLFARIILLDGFSFPTDPASGNCFRVEFDCGNDVMSDVDRTARQAILMLVAHWYDNRGTVIVGAVSKEMEFAVHALLGPDRVVSV